MERKRIAIFVYSLEGGGAERVISLLLNLLKNRFDIHLILIENKIEYTIPPDITIHYLGTKSQTIINKSLSLLSLSIKLSKYLKKNKISICMSFLSRPNFILCIAALMGLKNTCKCIISERTCPSAYHESLSRSAALISRFLVKNLYPISDLIVTNSLYSKHDLITNFDLPGSKISVIYNPINLQATYTPEPKVSNKFFTFVHVGRFRSEKNHLLLIRAFYKLSGVLPVRLILVGDGPTKKEVEQEVEDLGLQNSIVFEGFNSHPFDIIYQADCMVLSSNFEGFPNVLLEGMSGGLPIISTDCYSGPRELLAPETDYKIHNNNKVEYANYGILVPTNNADLLAEAMKLICQEKDLQTKYANQSILRVGEFNLDAIYNQYEKLFS